MKQPFFARRSFLIILGVAFLLPLIWAGTKRALLSNKNDVRKWLPKGFQETTDHHWFQKHFPHEQFVLASWEGCTLHDPGRLELFARKLEDIDPNLEDLGITRRIARRLEAKGLLTRQSIEDYGDLTSIEGIDRQQAAEVTQAIDAWVSPFKRPVLTGHRLVNELQLRYQNLSEEEVLKRLEGSLIGKDHDKTCLVVTLADTYHGRELRAVLDRIRHIAVEECAIPREELRLGGPPVDNAAIDYEGERTLMRLAGLSLVVGLGISWCCFRSIRLTLMVFICALLSAGVGMALVYYTGGIVDAVLLSMPSLVYVLAISGAVHIVNYYYDAIREKGLTGAPARALGHGWKPCTIAAVTTALGLGSLMTSQLIPISNFGLYSALGVLATLGFIFLLLPALLNYFHLIGRLMRGFVVRFLPLPALIEYADSRVDNLPPGVNTDNQSDNSAFSRFWQTVGGFVVRRNGWVTAGCLALMIFFAFGVTRIKTSIKLMKLFSSEAKIIAYYTWLEKHLGPLVPMEVVIRVDNQKCKLNMVQRMRMVRDVEEAIEEQLSEDVGGALSAATFAPPIGNTPKTAKKRFAYNIKDATFSRQLDERRDALREYLGIDKEKAVADENSNPSLHELELPAKIAGLLEAQNLLTLNSIQQCENLESIDGMDARLAAKVDEAIEAWRIAHRDPTLEELGISGEVAQALEARNLGTLTAIEKFGDRKSIQDNLVAIRRISPEQAAEVARTVDRWRTDHGEELWRISARVWALTPLDYSVFVHKIKAEVEKVLDQKYRKVKLTQRDRRKGIQPTRGVHVTYTGLVPLIYKAQHELMSGLFNSLVLAFVLIAGVMVLVLRSPSAGLLAMVPNIFPVVVIFGVMGWLGVLVDVGSMMSASVALGVAVDDTIHYLTWFRDGLDRGYDRKGAVMWAYKRCAKAMSQTTLIGGLGLAVFAFSTFTPTQRFGVLMLALLVAALVGDLIFLPAVLSGPIGRVFRARKKTSPQELSPDRPGEKITGDEVPAPPSADILSRRHVRRDRSHRSPKAS